MSADEAPQAILESDRRAEDARRDAFGYSFNTVGDRFGNRFSGAVGRNVQIIASPDMRSPSMHDISAG